MTSAFRIIKPKVMKNIKGREGGHKIRIMGCHCLWMTASDTKKLKSQNNLGKADGQDIPKRSYS
jgi:hypothetical protein